MKKEIAEKLILKTRDDYNLIAEQFASTRKYNWIEVTETLNDILQKFPKNKTLKVLDIGCGAGRVSEMFIDREIEYYGIDISEELIRIAKKKYPKAHFLVGDATNLPYQSDTFNIVVSIATIHHIPSKETRQKFLDEMYRVTKPEGWAFVETWYFWNKTEYLKRIVKSFFSNNSLHFGDFYRPWKLSTGKLVTKRYFHAWTIRELKKSITNAGFSNVQIYNFYRKTRNLNVIAEKPTK